MRLFLLLCGLGRNRLDGLHGRTDVSHNPLFFITIALSAPSHLPEPFNHFRGLALSTSLTIKCMR
jgi:hypothetical protein